MVRILEMNQEAMRDKGIEHVDASISEIPYQQLVCEGDEAGRSDLHAPRRVQVPSGRQPLHPEAVERVDVDETVSRSGHVVMPVGVLLGVGDVDQVVDHPNAEWRVSG